MSNASDRRYAALKALGESIVTTELFLTTDESGVERFESRNVWHRTDTAEVASSIRELAKLGRTERWTGQVEGYARMVEESTPDTYEWAILQGSVWVSYAAE